MSKLVFEQISNELKVNEDGIGYSSIRGAARLAGVSDMALRKAFDSANLSPSRLAENLMEQGFEAANLKEFSQKGIPDTALSIILFYYAFEAANNCTEQAKSAYKAFAATGLRAVIQDICGYKKEVEKPKSAIELLEWHVSITKEHEQRLLKIEEENKRLLETQNEIDNNLAELNQTAEVTLERLDQIEVEQDRYNSPAGHKYTILGFAKLQNLEISNTQASGLGRRASRLCRERGIEPETIYDPRYGRVGLYPESVLIAVFQRP